jgi:hypothetical protein
MPNLLLKQEKHITKSALFQFAPILFRRLLQPPDRQHVYGFGIIDQATGKLVTYIYNEGEGGKGGNNM